jgi:uncharacterized membrane protein YfhO
VFVMLRESNRLVGIVGSLVLLVISKYYYSYTKTNILLCYPLLHLLIRYPTSLRPLRHNC